MSAETSERIRSGQCAHVNRIKIGTAGKVLDISERGLSPGFRVAPDGERIERRGKDVLRTITAADLFEVSAVTRPAYPEAQIEARNWSPVRTLPTGRALGADFRWRR